MLGRHGLMGVLRVHECRRRVKFGTTASVKPERYSFVYVRGWSFAPEVSTDKLRRTMGFAAQCVALHTVTHSSFISSFIIPSRAGVFDGVQFQRPERVSLSLRHHIIVIA